MVDIDSGDVLSVLLVPVFNGQFGIPIVDFLRALGQPDIVRLGVLQKTDERLWILQFRRVDRGRERMQELGPSLVVQPKHGRTFFAEIPLRGGDRLLRGPAIHDSFVDRYVLLPFDLQGVGVGAQVDRAAHTADFATYRAQTELVCYRSARLDTEFHSAAVAASLEFDGHDGVERGCMGISEMSNVCSWI